jgi:hypothetical protein
MADHLKGRESHTQGVEVDRVFVGGSEAAFIFGKGTQVFPNLPVPIYGCAEVRMADETDALWFEFGFKIDTALSGNSAAGFNDAGNYLRIEIVQSTDLVTWAMGKFVPCAVPVVDHGDGTRTYWSRSTVPVWWYNVIADLSVSVDRYGKSLTGLSIGGVNISLPGYPYAMPASAATLQAHLRTAGYTGALVTNVPASLTVGIINYQLSGRRKMPVTMSGSNVTMVQWQGSNISLPGYPYAMPSQHGALQTALRNAGYTGAVVSLYADEWTIFLPDRPAAGNLQRQIIATFTPDDPYPAWDFFGTYLGFQSSNAQTGVASNIRAGVGEGVLDEALKQFARLKISGGPRYDPWLP